LAWRCGVIHVAMLVRVSPVSTEVVLRDLMIIQMNERVWKIERLGDLKLSGKAPTLVLVLKLAVHVQRNKGLRSPAKVRLQRLSHITFSFYVTGLSPFQSSFSAAHNRIIPEKVSWTLVRRVMVPHGHHLALDSGFRSRPIIHNYITFRSSTKVEALIWCLDTGVGFRD